jgi:hypothetical protein
MPIDSKNFHKQIGKFEDKSQNKSKIKNDASQISDNVVSDLSLVNDTLLLATLLTNQNSHDKKHSKPHVKRDPNKKLISDGSPNGHGKDPEKGARIEIINSYQTPPKDLLTKSRVSIAEENAKKLQSEISPVNKPLETKVTTPSANRELPASIQQLILNQQLTNPSNLDLDKPFMRYHQIVNMVVAEKNDPGPLNIIIANEAYTASEISLKKIMEVNFKDIDSSEKQEIARNILTTTSMGFQHNFLHLISSPVAQIEDEMLQYQSLLKTTRDFLIESKLPAGEAFSSYDSNGNTPLHTMVALSSKEQFRIFMENFNDLIPSELWHHKNHHGISALDILSSQKNLEKAIVEISDNMNVDTSVSCTIASDIVSKEKTTSRSYCNANPFIPEGKKDPVVAYPLGIYQCQENGDIIAVDPLTNKKLQSFTPKQFESLQPYLSDSLTYSQKSLSDRLEKLQDLENALTTEPSTSIRMKVLINRQSKDSPQLF